VGRDIALSSRGLRRTQRSARGGREPLAASDRADLHHSLDSQHFSAHLPQVLGRDQRDVKPIYTAVNATAARSAFDELTEKWGQRYPAVIPAVGQRLERVHPVFGL
jgi:Transposase, Mutator family